MTTTPSIEEIKTVILQLAIEELSSLMAAIEEKLETVKMMQLAQNRFSRVERSRGRYLLAQHLSS